MTLTLFESNATVDVVGNRRLPIVVVDFIRQHVQYFSAQCLAKVFQQLILHLR